MNYHSAKLSEIASLVNVDFVGDDVTIENLNLCNRPTSYNSILGYTTSTKFIHAISQNKAVKALVVSEDVYSEINILLLEEGRKMSYIITGAPEIIFYDIHEALVKRTNFYVAENKEPQIGENCNIHPSAVIEQNVKVGNNVTIGPNSVVRSGSIIDDNVSIGCCSVIGSEGFQAIKGYDKMVKHVGGTHISEGVHIGDNTTIGNALFEGNTEVGSFSKISNHVQISHNCTIGKRCVITTNCIMMGSSHLLPEVWLAPNSVILNGVTIGEDAMVGTLTYANCDVPSGKTVVGIPCRILNKHEH